MPDDLILIAVLIILVLAVAGGLFTRRGSGIEEHPSGSSPRPGPRP